MVYLPVLFQLVVFLLSLVQWMATVHLAQMIPKPHHLQHPHRLRHPAFSVVTMTPLHNRSFRSAPHRLVLLHPKAIRSFSLHKLHLALNAVPNPKFMLINRGLIFFNRFRVDWKWKWYTLGWIRQLKNVGFLGSVKSNTALKVLILPSLLLPKPSRSIRLSKRFAS